VTTGGAATLAADAVLAPLLIELPPVERRAVLPAGFVAGATTCGIKASGRPDLAVIASPGVDAAAAGVFTQNRFAAAPVRLSQEHLRASSGRARAVVSTSGSANAATGPAGDADQLAIVEHLASVLDVPLDRVLCMSTGVIGTRLPVGLVASGVESLVSGGLSADSVGLEAAAQAMMTTDSRVKLATTTVQLGDPAGVATEIRVSGIAKGVGMIHPGMATMLAVLLTDAAVEPRVLDELLRQATTRTWNQLSVDGDTSTNDTVILLASGAAGTRRGVGADGDRVVDGGGVADPGSDAATALGKAVDAVARDLARQQAADGEGASTLVTCQVSGAADDADARAVARAVVSSSLVKAAVHGRDPNWGRIAGAAGNAAADVDPQRVRIAIAGHLVYDGSRSGPIAFDRAAAQAAMDAPEVLFRLDLGLGDGRGEAFGCDLTEEYVRENSEYTT
jgi:glutamate N-acetyltransferase/amino-acid N-acetyltransferase